jgi:glycerophosphoryl diester phosphodiesterase
MRSFFRILLGILGIVLVLGLAIYGVFSIRATPMPAHAFFRADDSLPLVIAHQGGDGERPSNTMTAFQYAVDLGVDVLEMDIHSTSDGVLVTIHDATVDRTTDSTGRVHDFTFAELQALDAGYDWPTVEEEVGRTDRPYRGQGIVIPALEEVFRTFPQMRMVIEIKQTEPSIVQPFCDLLREHELQEQVIVASFHPEPMYAFREACPEVATAAVEEEILPFFVLNTVGLSGAYQPTAESFQVPEYSGDLHVVTPSFVENAHAKNVMVQPWTINSTAQMQYMIEVGVNGIMTDYPARLMELLGRNTGE